MTARDYIDPSRVGSILVHKPDHLGDALTAAPAVAAVRRYFPEARLTAGVMRVPAAFWLELELIDDWIELPGPFWWRGATMLDYLARVRPRRFDLVVNLRHDMRDIAAASLFGARHVVSPTHRGIGSWRRRVAEPPSETRPEIENHLAVAARVVPVEPFVPGMFRDRLARLSNGDSAPTGVVFHPFARTPAKTWPAGHARRLLELLRDAGAPVTLVGGAEHRADSETIAAGLDGVTNRVGATDPKELMELVARAAVFVGVDSGPGHLAPLFGTPVVTIAGGTNVGRRYMPWGAVVLRHNVLCAPCRLEVCNQDGHPCMTGVDPARVADEVLRMVGAP